MPADLKIFADVIRKIPRGKVATYGQIAALAGFPRSARQVGMGAERLPRTALAPVLGAGGAIRLPGWQALEQRMRLEIEGVRFRARASISSAPVETRLSRNTSSSLTNCLYILLNRRRPHPPAWCISEAKRYNDRLAGGPETIWITRSRRKNSRRPRLRRPRRERASPSSASASPWLA